MIVRLSTGISSSVNSVRFAGRQERRRQRRTGLQLPSSIHTLRGLAGLRFSRGRRCCFARGFRLCFRLGRSALLNRAMFVETNPVPAKAALACLGIATAHVRLPLSPAEPATWTAVQRALAGLQAHRRTVRLSERLVGLAS